MFFIEHSMHGKTLTQQEKETFITRALPRTVLCLSRVDHGFEILGLHTSFALLICNCVKYGSFPIIFLPRVLIIC